MEKIDSAMNPIRAQRSFAAARPVDSRAATNTGTNAAYNDPAKTEIANVGTTEAIRKMSNASPMPKTLAT